MRSTYIRKIYLCVGVLAMTGSMISMSSAQSPIVIELKKPAPPVNTYINQPVNTYIQMEEPARWTQEDITPAQKYSTATKESTAALYEANKNCQTLDPSQRTSCAAQARIIFNEEMSAIRIRFQK